MRERPLILLVDDCADNRAMYAVCLSRRGFEIAEAADGRSAVSQALALRPDLVVMDLTLPDMDGEQAVHSIKSDERTKDLPVVVVSGYASADESTGRGPPFWDAFLSKPCMPDVLENEIRRILA